VAVAEHVIRRQEPRSVFVDEVEPQEKDSPFPTNVANVTHGRLEGAADSPLSNDGSQVDAQCIQGEGEGLDAITAQAIESEVEEHGRGQGVLPSRSWPVHVVAPRAQGEKTPRKEEAVTFVPSFLINAGSPG